MESVKERNFSFGEQFKQRTKSFSLRVIKLFQALPKSTEAQILVSSYCVRQHQWLQTIERPAEQGRKQNLLRKWE